MEQEKEQIIKYNVTYFTDNDEDEPHEVVFAYTNMPAHTAKYNAISAAQAYNIDTRFTAFEIQQILLN